jgi:type IV secretion system protein VirB1
MVLALLTFTQLLQSCAPNIGPRTMTAIVHVESGGNRFAVRDNTLDRAFYPKSTDEAVRLANYLLGKHHNLDLGISQLNSANLPGLGMSVRQTFNPCDNLRGGASILAGDYRRAVAKFGPGQYALRRAIGAYNTGSLFAGNKYISMILDAAGIQERPVNVARVPNLTAESQPATTVQSRRHALPQGTTQAQTVVAPVAIRPEMSPILVHWNNRSTAPVIASGGQAMTHIPLNQVNQTGMMHIPLTGPGQEQDVTPQDAPSRNDTASAVAPIILQALPAGTAQFITPQQLLEAAAAQRRRR